VRIAVASGKGGTGKTTIATSLALSLVAKREVHYVDCDVEAPNGHIFLKPQITHQSDAVILIPVINKDICSLCGRCVEVCQFHALAKIGKVIMTFPQLCHGCGSCTIHCPEHAIEELANPIGVIESGFASHGLIFSQGCLNISEPMATPIIRQLKKSIIAKKDSIIVLDAPPGASCSVVETLRGVDFALLVAEPTPFGVHDLRQMIGIVTEMGISAGVIVNREKAPFPPLESLCSDNNLPILLHIPFDRRIASGLAEGLTLLEINSDYSQMLQDVYGQIIFIMARNKE
jgi:MinD superfamily P-loop ATPase